MIHRINRLFALNWRFSLFWSFGHFVSEYFVNSCYCVTLLERGPFEAAYHRSVSAVTTEGEEDDCFHVLDIQNCFFLIQKLEAQNGRDWVEPCWVSGVRLV